MLKKPRIYKPGVFNIPPMGKLIMTNGLPVYYFTDASSDTIKLEWCFPAGRSFERKALTSKFTNTMFREGTTKQTGYEIAEFFDYYGSYLGNNVGMDYTSLSFLCMTTYFEPLWHKLAEVILQPAFPEDELALLKRNSISRLRQDMDDADFVAYREVTENIFGPSHPYGYNSENDLINAVTREDLIAHWKTSYFNDRSFLVLSGRVDQDALKIIEQTVADITLEQVSDNFLYPNPAPGPQKVSIAMDNKNQCSIKIGQRCISRSHRDFGRMFVFNTLFGGYFHSRLNLQIREKKGLTYGISSAHDTYYFDGLFYVSADTSSEHKKELIDEVFVQLDKLRQKPVSLAELDRVKSYLLGNLRNNFDGVYQCGEALKTCVVEGTTYQSLQALIYEIHQMTPADLLEAGQTHLHPEGLHQVIVG